MTSRALEFWHEFASTYSPVAEHRIAGAARAAGVPVYMWQDLERQCATHGVPFRKPQRAAEFSRRVDLANFHGDADTTNDDIVRGSLNSLGWSDAEDVLARAISAETKERVRQRSDEAFERGIFGTPTFPLGSELYWGNDRLEDALTSCVASS